ncbi:unnamed protein product [Paramecium pentaurelia]|uniref:Uncharacterized protein n=1 Tax=Paramecium pentaurelia TaxID=43138 RepID=A0A8S1TK18_9CILI|nr:unnamed protein product [Paramecium pentaurelia]
MSIWIELSDIFLSHLCWLIQDKNKSRKIGFHIRKNNTDGGPYNEKGDWNKKGRWIELIEGFKFLFNGINDDIYRNGQKVCR